jgi:hypothetical protein
MDNNLINDNLSMNPKAFHTSICPNPWNNDALERFFLIWKGLLNISVGKDMRFNSED